MKTQSYQETITGMEPETMYFFMIKAVSESRSLVTDEFVVSQTTGIQKVSNFDEIYHKPLAMMNFSGIGIYGSKNLQIRFFIFKSGNLCKDLKLKRFFFIFTIFSGYSGLEYVITRGWHSRSRCQSRNV